MSIHGSATFDELSPQECLALLAQVPVGRIALSVRALPVIFPVNHVVRDGDVIFLTSSGTKLAAATSGTIVAFEVDRYDDSGDSGWSVLIQGRAEEITDGETVAEVQKLPLHAWALDGKADHYVRIRTMTISGRRFRPAAPDDGARGLS